MHYYVSSTIHWCYARVPDLSRQRLVFFPFLPKLLLTITICCCCKSNHIPTTLGCHGNIFWYVEAQAFTYTLVPSKCLRNILMSRYSHLCTKIHKCVVFYSLGYRHCSSCLLPFMYSRYNVWIKVVYVRVCKTYSSKIWPILLGSSNLWSERRSIVLFYPWLA